jgi:hypothetical protein
MGRGPDSHIAKKLIRKYFKFDLKRTNFNSAEALYPDLLNAWNKHGMNSEQAELVQQKIDLATNTDESEYRDIKKMTKDLPYNLNQMLPKIKTKYAYKGRTKNLSATYREPTERVLNEMDKFYRF